MKDDLIKWSNISRKEYAFQMDTITKGLMSHRQKLLGKITVMEASLSFLLTLGHKG